VNTADKRASAILLALPFRSLLPLPDAPAEDQADRQQVAGLYRGILADAAAVVTEFEDLTTVFVPHLWDTLYDGTPTDDVNTLLARDIPVVRADADSVQQDLNTDYVRYLS
jgi:hypothetical protein